MATVEIRCGFTGSCVYCQYDIDNETASVYGFETASVASASEQDSYGLASNFMKSEDDCR